jgi:plastocyanin
MRRILSLSAVLVLAGSLAACGSSSSSSGGYGSSTPKPKPAASTATAGGPVTKLGAHDFAFDPTTLSLTAGAATITVKNSGAIKHNLTIEGLKVNKDLPAGATTSVNLTAKAGTYPFHCEYHPTTMKGTVTVG